MSRYFCSEGDQMERRTMSQGERQKAFGDLLPLQPMQSDRGEHWAVSLALWLAIGGVALLCAAVFA